MFYFTVRVKCVRLGEILSLALFTFAGRTQRAKSRSLVICLHEGMWVNFLVMTCMRIELASRD